MRRSHEQFAAAGVLALLSACASNPKVEPEREYRELPVAVAVGCVKDRPARPQTLLERFTDDEWSALAPGAMARSVEAQAGDRMNYSDRLDAATKGCREKGR